MQMVNPALHLILLHGPFAVQAFVQKTEFDQSLVDPFAVFGTIKHFKEAFDFSVDIGHSLLVAQARCHCLVGICWIECTHEVLMIKP